MAAIIIRLILRYVPEVASGVWSGIQRLRNLPLPAGSGPILMMTAQLLIFPAIGSVAMYVRQKAFDLKVLPTPPRQQGTLNRALGHVSYLWGSEWHSVLSQWTAFYKGLFKLRLLLTNVVVVTDPSLVAEVLGPDARGVPQRTVHHQFYDQCMGASPTHPSMFGTHDEAHWSATHRGITPAFSAANIRLYCLSLFNACDAMLADIEQQRTRSTNPSANGALSPAPSISSRQQTAAVPAQQHPTAAAAAAAAALHPSHSIDLLPHLMHMSLRAALEGLLDADLGQLGFSTGSASVSGAAHDANIGRGHGSGGGSRWTTIVNGGDKCISAAELPVRMAQLLETARGMATNPLQAWLMQNMLAQALIPAAGRWADAKQDVRDFFFTIAQQIHRRPAVSASSTQLWACLQRLTDAGGSPCSMDALTSEVGMIVCMATEKCAATIAWCLYCAAAHPTHQEAVYQELMAAGLAGPSARTLAQDDLSRLPVMSAFVNEVMRLYPTAAVSTSRHATHAKRIGGYLVPSGVTVWAPIYGVHTSLHNWDEPVAFRPERWAQPDAACQQGSTQHLRFMPFGAGTKQCMGQAYATVSVQSCVVRMLAAYRVTAGPGLVTADGASKLSSTGFAYKLSRLPLLLEKRH